MTKHSGIIYKKYKFDHSYEIPRSTKYFKEKRAKKRLMFTEEISRYINTQNRRCRSRCKCTSTSTPTSTLPNTKIHLKIVYTYTLTPGYTFNNFYLEINAHLKIQVSSVLIKPIKM